MNGLAAALIATTAAQALATLAVYVLAVLAPTVSRALDVPPQLVGIQVAIIYGTAAVTSFFAGELLARIGPARVTQLAMALGACGTVAIAAGGLPGAALGSLLLGIGYGWTTPAATQVLNRLVPPARRNLVFAVKQMGVPIGGALAGLTLPSLALLLGWRGAALCVAAALALAAVALTPFRRPWDSARGTAPASRGGGFAVLRQGRGLGALALMGALFSAIQLIFGAHAVTMLVGEFGWTPVAAGAAASMVQVSGAVSRLLWALLADRVGRGMALLALIGLGTAGATFTIAFAPGWPVLAVLLLLAAFGACSAGWTGVAMAEVARLAPPGAAGAATGAVMSVTFGGIVFGPLLFAGAVTVLGSYTAAFAVVALLPLAGAAVAWKARDSAGQRGA